MQKIIVFFVFVTIYFFGYGQINKPLDLFKFNKPNLNQNVNDILKIKTQKLPNVNLIGGNDFDRISILPIDKMPCLVPNINTTIKIPTKHLEVSDLSGRYNPRKEKDLFDILNLPKPSLLQPNLIIMNNWGNNWGKSFNLSSLDIFSSVPKISPLVRAPFKLIKLDTYTGLGRREVSYYEFRI